MQTAICLLLVVFFLLMNAFFVIAEFALVRVRKSQIDMAVAEKRRGAEAARDVTTHINAYLSACQLGITLASLASVFTDGHAGYPPATAAACIQLLDHYQVPLQGKHVVVVGRSLVVGKPVSMMLLRRNASVTICHSKTENLADIMRSADVVICATGRARTFGAQFFGPGQTVLDVGINFDTQGNLCGDVDFAEVEPVVAAITPVPGGIGTVTTSVTMAHTVAAAEAALAARTGRR